MFKVGIVKDKSLKYDGYYWHDVYSEEFKRLGNKVVLLDFDLTTWREDLESEGCDFLIWRAWHRPEDKYNAKEKIYFISNFLKIPIYPSEEMYFSYDNKNIQFEILKYHKIKQPETNIFRNINEAKKFIEKTKFPLVAKSSEGACGDNVFLIRNKIDAIEYIDSCFSDSGRATYFSSIRQFGYVYFQEYIESNRDLRIITIGDKVELAFWRENSNSWKKNIWLGGQINIKNIPEKAKDIALEIAKKNKFHWCAVDIIEKNGDYFVLEFSSIFGFSSKGDYEKVFGSKNGFVLRKQAEYLNNLYIKKNG